MPQLYLSNEIYQKFSSRTAAVNTVSFCYKS